VLKEFAPGSCSRLLAVRRNVQAHMEGAWIAHRRTWRALGERTGALGGHLEGVQARLEGTWRAYRRTWRALAGRTGALGEHLVGIQARLENTWRTL
jgi:hypothetical protein